MKLKNIKYFMAAAAVGLGMTSCEDFLDRPTEDSYTASTYYSTDAQCIAGVNYLYNSPWYDFQRGFFKVGEVLSGNYYWGSSPYLTFTIKGDDEDLANMSASLWAVNGHCNTVYDNIKAASGPSKAVKDQCLGECLVWKAMAYFYLVRTFGEIPLIHSNSDIIAAGSINEQYKVQKADIYEYIVMTLEKAIELLPSKCTAGRLDKDCAKGLLAKVYLTKAGVTGSLNQSDLQKAAEYAQDVMDNSGRSLMQNFADVFRGSNNNCDEILIAWRWTVGAQWTCQNTFQSDLGIVGFDEYGDTWGGWAGPSVDLQDAFGVSAIEDPSSRNDADTRRKATMMLAGDKYDYFWADKGGFDLLKFFYDEGDYGKGGPGGSWQCPTGAFSVKHLYGNEADHQREMGMSATRMSSALCTPLLRLSDVYLVLAEAKVLMGQGSDAKALEAFNAVRQRAIPTAEAKTSLTFDDVWKERRLELACEGDRWYDFVRLSYYDSSKAIAELKAQRRNSYTSLDILYKSYYNKGEYIAWPTDGSMTEDGTVIYFDNEYHAGDKVANVYYDTTIEAPNVTESSFTIPLASSDLIFNPHLNEPAIHVDVRETFSY